MEIIYNEHRFSEDCRCRDCIFSQSVPVPGYERYRAFPDGRIWSHARLPGTFLKPMRHGTGYMEVTLFSDMKVAKRLKVHRLVAMAYIENPDNKPQVDHINRVRSDNRISNLRWVTPLENMENKGMYKSNKSGHKNICYFKTSEIRRWQFKKTINNKRHQKYFETKIDALCYKYIIMLKLRAGTCLLV